MKTSTGLLKGMLIAASLLFGLSACQKSDNNPTPLVKTYNIVGYPGFNVSGTATFKEVLNKDSVLVTVNLQGSSVTNVSLFPLYIREGTSLENGDVKFNLGNLDGGVGTLQAELPISFSNLLKLNGSLDVYRNTVDTTDVIAQGELGVNEVYKSYNLYDPANSSTVNGQFRVYKRPTGCYLVIKTKLTNLDALCSGHPHPAGVYKTSGAPDFSLTPVIDSTGVSATSLPDHTFDDMTHYDGSVKVLCSDVTQSFILSEGKFQ